ncbi:cytochrome C [Hydrogenimonas urashimensis]|uniref:cytochrome C n=1 Tax=Hydrogenimonas urashimensis TaxID=2740515 RepID=UPI001916B890|nr:cytochrome C [Hydrogenimonas urashimensis]
MKSSLTKARIFTFIAFGLLMYYFVIPAVFTHDVIELVRAGKADKIPPVAYKVWNYYAKNIYVSPSTPKEAVGDLKKMIEEDAELSVVSAPIWYVALEAPNYPKEAFPEGIPVYYHFDGFSGDVHEMNTINHYIGMDPMERGAPYLRALAPYALVLVALLMIYYMVYDSKILDLLMLLPVVLPVIFLGFYAYWLYWFGHHMHEWGAFKIKPFMPTVFGDGKVAQFTTHSYPTTGFWILLAISAFSLLAIISKKKARKLAAAEA